MKVNDVICVADFHDLCPRLSLQGSFGESRKVNVMEFGLKQLTVTGFVNRIYQSIIRVNQSRIFKRVKVIQTTARSTRER